MTEERSRLFVALDLSGPVREALISWRASVLHGVEGLRFVAPGALHVTLCFLGSLAVAEIDQIGAACDLVAAQRIPRLTLAGPVWLPARRPRVLAVELAESDHALGVVQAALAGALQAGGWYEPEPRPFLAHVTVARVTRGARIRPQDIRAPRPLSFEGPVVTLYRSRPGPGGARYEPLRSIELGTAADQNNSARCGKGFAYPSPSRTGNSGISSTPRQ